MSKIIRGFEAKEPFEYFEDSLVKTVDIVAVVEYDNGEIGEEIVSCVSVAFGDSSVSYNEEIARVIHNAIGTILKSFKDDSVEKVYSLVWVDEEEKWHYLKDGKRPNFEMFPDGYGLYDIHVSKDGVILNDELNETRNGDLFIEHYDINLWNIW